ncbi:MAG: hypothetical protein DHS20C05_12470 [Hyphococcus sp.]|nr:MAG: hypothetical protein DHS20C05_12470 [Marinicaulis sp.]
MSKNSATDAALEKKPTASASPALTIIVVSDFEADREKSWKDEISMARALAAQDIGAPFKVVIAECEIHQNERQPDELTSTLDDLEIVYGPDERSAALKDLAVAQCNTPWVAVLEADALPSPNWARLLMEAAHQNPDYDIFSGRTYYGDETSWMRVLNLLDRSFDDRGASGDTSHVSNNGALYRTELLKEFPYPDAGSPFLSSRKRNAAMQRAGYRFYSQRNALMRHAVGGLDFVNDFRRNTGYSDMMTLTHRSPLKIPGLTARRMKSEIGSALRVGGEYLKWFDWPLFALMFLYVRLPELAGMRSALQNSQHLKNTAYR